MIGRWKQWTPTSAPDVKWFAAGAALVLTVAGGFAAYRATRNEITGQAIYHKGGRHDPGEPVMRESAPEKFRSATNLIWGASGFCFVVAAVGVVFYRKLDDCV